MCTLSGFRACSFDTGLGAWKWDGRCGSGEGIHNREPTSTAIIVYIERKSRIRTMTAVTPGKYLRKHLLTGKVKYASEKRAKRQKKDLTLYLAIPALL